MDNKILDAIHQEILYGVYSQTTEGGFEWEQNGYTIELTSQFSPCTYKWFYVINFFTDYGMQQFVVAPNDTHYSSISERWRSLSKVCFPQNEIIKLFK